MYLLHHSHARAWKVQQVTSSLHPQNQGRAVVVFSQGGRKVQVSQRKQLRNTPVFFWNFFSFVFFFQVIEHFDFQIFSHKSCLSATHISPKTILFQTKPACSVLWYPAGSCRVAGWCRRAANLWVWLLVFPQPKRQQEPTCTQKKIPRVATMTSGGWCMTENQQPWRGRCNSAVRVQFSSPRDNQYVLRRNRHSSTQ